MTVYLVGGGPGQANLVTLRAAELLARADVVVVDRLVGDEVLRLIRDGARIIDVGKSPTAKGHGGDESTHQEAINRVLVEEGLRGGEVIRLKGGDPFLFGRGGEEAEALRDAGVAFEIVPGVSSAFALPALAGVPVTHRGVSRAVVVVSGHEPVEASSVDWARLASSGATLVVLMGVGRRGAIADALMAGGLGPSTPVVAVERGATPHERRSSCVLGELATTEISPPAVMVIGRVAALDFRDLPHLSLRGVRVGVTRPSDSQALIEKLRSRGAAVADVPLLKVSALDGEALMPLGAVLARTDDVAWVAVTSRRAISGVVAATGDLRRLSGVRIAAVGPSTAAALTAVGLPPDLVGDAADGASGLVDLIGVPSDERRRVIFASTEGARRDLPVGLEAAGWIVDERPAYSSVDAVLSSDDAAALKESDVVVVTSPRGVERLAGSGGEALIDMTTPLVVIGATSAEAARAAGFTDVILADGASDAGLIGALEAWADRGRDGA
ncbi:MAG: uroporphyrinogen-III C-methyltransferase [Actinomycetes bacterium]